MIKCHIYDHVEIVCMFHYPIKLTLSDGSEFTCSAIDTQINKHKQECMRVESEGVEDLVILENIAEMEVLVKNPYFNKIKFN